MTNEEKIDELRKMLNSKLINEESYNREVKTIEYLANKDKEKKKTKADSLLKNGLKVVFAILFVAGILWLSNNIGAKKDTEKVASLGNLAQPVQSTANGQIVKNIFGWNTKIIIVATYKISGRVVNVENYYGSSIQDMLSPKDVGICWGSMVLDKYQSKIRWSSAGDRFLKWRVDDGNWLMENGGKSIIDGQSSNNHLIPNDDAVREKIHNIKEGDYVRIEGYLVNIYGQKNDGHYFKWNTSTTRSDTGNGACEIIYVTNVVWLQK